MAFDQPSLKWWVHQASQRSRLIDIRSAPFNLADIGRTNLALQRLTTNHGERTYLMRVEAHIQGSSLFTYISRETEPWPLKIRNATNLKLTYQQVVSSLRSPLVCNSAEYRQDDDGTKQKHSVYEVGPKGEADYTWDIPTAGNKRLQISCDGVPLPKNIDMMAIGIQPPMKVSVSHHLRSRSAIS